MRTLGVQFYAASAVEPLFFTSIPYWVSGTVVGRKASGLLFSDRVYMIPNREWKETTMFGEVPSGGVGTWWARGGGTARGGAWNEGGRSLGRFAGDLLEDARVDVSRDLDPAVTHDSDIVDALDVRREPTARLRNICHVGYRTRGFAYTVRGLKVSEGHVRETLTAPDGSAWEWGSGRLADDWARQGPVFRRLPTDGRPPST